MNIKINLKKVSICLALILSLVVAPIPSSLSNVQAEKIDDIVDIAKSKKGKGIKSFPSYFHKGRWCSDFVWWSANKAGLMNGKTFPKSRLGGVSSFQSWYTKKGLYKKNTKKYTPKKGDLAFFRPNSHIGIVTKVTKSHVTIVHGNWSSRVKVTKIKRFGYDSRNKTAIKGYARPDYEASEKKKFKLVFNANGGSVDKANKTITYNKTYGALPSPKKEDHKFLGWYTTKSTKGEQVTKTTKHLSRKNVKVYARWEKDASLLPNEDPTSKDDEAVENLEYTLTFKANGGSVDLEEKKVVFSKEYGKLPTPTRTGYKFAGWYTSKSESGIKVTATTIHNVKDDIKLYARWTPIN